MISETANHVIVDKPTYAALRTKLHRQSELLVELRADRAELQTFLNIALHELALATGSKDPQYFARLWRRGKEAMR